jgi:hypothetical protein
MQELEKAQEKKISIKEIIKGSKGELISLLDFNETSEVLTSIAKKYEAYEVTDENFKESKEIRVEIREFRYSIQNIEKHNTKLLNDAKKIQKDASEKLIEIISPVENKIDLQIKLIENKKQLEKEAREKAEAERISNISRRIADARAGMEIKFQIGKTEEDLKLFDAYIQTLNETKESFEEFEFEAEDLILEFTEKRQVIVNRINEQIQLEAEKVKLEAEKLEQEKLQEQLRQQQEEINKQRAELEAEKQKANEERLAKEKAEQDQKEAEEKAKLQAELEAKQKAEKEEKERLESERLAIEQNIAELSYEDFLKLEHDCFKALDNSYFNQLENGTIKKAFAQFCLDHKNILEKFKANLFIK